MADGPALPRHTLLRVHAEAWPGLRAAHPNLAAEPLLADWAARAWPLIARRREPCDRQDGIPAGLPLPPSHGKKRLALTLPPGALARTEPPPTLADVRAAAPASWHPTIDSVLRLAARVGTNPRVFGSFAWTSLTGLAYVGASSDLDLLWTLSPVIDLDTLLSGLAAIEPDAPGRLDGEIVRPQDDAAVNWRELHQGAPEILVKTAEAVMLQPARWFLQTGASTP